MDDVSAVPVKSMSYSECYAALLAVLGTSDSWNLEISAWHHKAGPEGISWSVWIGLKACKLVANTPESLVAMAKAKIAGEDERMLPGDVRL